VAQAVEYLHSKSEALSSNTNTRKKLHNVSVPLYSQFTTFFAFMISSYSLINKWGSFVEGKWLPRFLGFEAESFYAAQAGLEFFFFLWFELKASDLLGRCSTTSAMLPIPDFLINRKIMDKIARCSGILQSSAFLSVMKCQFGSFSFQFVTDQFFF
jgi:hypothetical protein